MRVYVCECVCACVHECVSVCVCVCACACVCIYGAIVPPNGLENSLL